MKKLNKFLIALSACLLVSVLAYGGPLVVKSMPLSTEISATGSVRVVVEVTEQFTGFDMGVILHKEEFDAGWNQGLSAVLFNHSEKQLRGYNGDIPGWVFPESTKIFEIGDTVALWLTIDIANKTHTLHAQLQSETEVTTVFEDFQFRASVQGEPYDTAFFCTVFVNDRMGENASQAIEVIDDATVVDEIVPYFPLEVFNETEGFSTDGIYTLHCKGKKTFMADGEPGKPMAMKDSASFGDDCKFYIVVNPADNSKHNIITLDGRYLASTSGLYGTLIENTADNRNSTVAAVDMIDQATNEYFIETYPVIGDFDGSTLKRWNGQRGSGTQVGMGSTGSDNYKWNLTRVGDMPAANVAPTAIFLSADNIDENNAANATVAMLSASDANPFDSLTFSFAAGDGTNDADNGAFTITDNVLAINNTADFETKAAYHINVQVTDAGGLSFVKAFTIVVNNVNEAPTDLILSDTTITENNVAGAVVGTLSANDPDADETLTFSFEADSISGADNDAFTIANDALSINASADYLTKSEYKINVKVSDSGGLSFVKAFTITVIDFTETEGFTTDGIYTIHCQGKKTFMSSDGEPGKPLPLQDSTSLGDDNKLYIVTNPADASKINIITLDGRYVGSVHTSGYGTWIENIAANRDSSIAAANLLEQATNSYFIETFLGDGSQKLWNGQRNGSTAVGMGTSGNANYKWNLTRIGDVPASNVAPTAIFLSVDSLYENNAANATVGMLSASDANPFDTHTYSLVTGDGTNDADNGAFTITDNMLTINDIADFDVKSSYHINIKVTDADGLSFDKAFTIKVIEVVNTAPTAIALSSDSIAEDTPVGTLVGILSATDADADQTFTYSLSGVDAASFSIVADSLKSAEIFDFETKTSYSITITVSDGELTFSQDFTINIDNVVETSIESMELSKVTFYPNPVKNRLTVSGLTVDATAYFYTVSGTLVKVAEVNSTEKSINVSELSTGTYILKLAAEGGELVTKIIK